MQQPGIYEVGGLGACTLISSSALSSGISYDRVHNISYWGEDRHFCIRAAALGLPLFVDTHFPALHLYRDSDLDLVAEFIRHTSGTEAEPDASHEAASIEDSNVTSAEDLPDCAETDQPPLTKECRRQQRSGRCCGPKPKPGSTCPKSLRLLTQPERKRFIRQLLLPAGPS